MILKALAKMAWEREEVAAVMEGVADYEAGRCEPLEDFDRRYREELGIRSAA